MKNDDLRILVIGNSLHHTQNLLFLVRELCRRDPRIRTTLVCYASQYDAFAKQVSDCAVDVISFEHGSRMSRTAAPPAARDPRVSQTVALSGIRGLKRFRDRIVLALPVLKNPMAAMIAKTKRSTPGLVLRERALAVRLNQEKLKAERVLDQASPNVIVAFGDRHPDIEAPILLVARERGIKVVIPYISYSGKDILVEVRKDDPDFQAVKPLSFYGRRKAVYFRDQLHEGLFYQPPSTLAAYNRFGALSNYPWCLGNGLSDVVCVDSEATAQRYQTDRVPREKIRIIGDVVYDKIADAFHHRYEIKTALVKKYGFDERRKLIVLALPQLAEQGVMEWEPHWKEIRFLVEAVSSAAQNLLISLHPRMNPNNYAFIEKEYPCRIAQERLSDFISAPDIFMANYSSTVIWAVLCGIKTIVADFYGLNYSFFDHLKSVSIIRDRERLHSTLAAAVQEDGADFSADWKALSREAVFNGRTIERYLDLFRELANKSTMHNPLAERFQEAT